MRNILVLVAVVLGAFSANAEGSEEWPPGAFEDVTVTLYVCASGDFAVLYNEDALDRLDECSEGISGARVSLHNIKEDSVVEVTGPDGTSVLGPIAMSSVYPGSLRIIAEQYACLTLWTRIGEGQLRPGENLLAVRLDELDLGDGQCKADEP